MPDEVTTNGQTSYNPFSRAIPIAVSTPMLGVNRKVEVSDTSAIEDVENANLLRVSKVLIECDEYDAIKSYVNKLKSNLRKISVPGGRKLFRAGTYPVVKTRLPDALRMLKAAEQELPRLVDAFVTVYEKRRDENIRGLGKLANAADYPAPSKVKEHFGLDYEFIQYGIPEEIKGLDPAMFGAEFERLQSKFRQAGEEGIQALKLLFQESVNAFCEALKPGADGKKKQVASPLKKLKEFMTDFESIFVGTELESWNTKLQSILAGTNPESLRESPNTRKLVEKRTAEVQDLINKSVGVAAARKFRGSEE